MKKDQLPIKEQIKILKDALATTKIELEEVKAQETPVGRMTRLDHQTKKLQEDIGLAELQERQEQQKPFLDEIAKGLRELQTGRFSQIEVWAKLTDLEALGAQVSALLQSRRRWRRMEQLKVEVLDPEWRGRLVPQIESEENTPLGVLERGLKPDPAREKEPVHTWIRGHRAEVLERQGKVKILKGEYAIFEEIVIPDPVPPVLSALQAVNLGPPVKDAEGAMLPEFEKLKEFLGEPFEISWAHASKIEGERRRIETWKKRDKEQKAKAAKKS